MCRNAPRAELGSGLRVGEARHRELLPRQWGDADSSRGEKWSSRAGFRTCPAHVQPQLNSRHPGSGELRGTSSRSCGPVPTPHCPCPVPQHHLCAERGSSCLELASPLTQIKHLTPLPKSGVSVGHKRCHHHGQPRFREERAPFISSCLSRPDRPGFKAGSSQLCSPGKVVQSP